jgi:undecaprenyl-diphosphatase
MLLLDVTVIKAMPPRGSADVALFRIVTDFGKAAYVIDGLLVLLATIVLGLLFRGPSRLILMGFARRVVFILLAVVVPLMASEVIKIVIGRGRPFVGGEANAFYFSPFAAGEQFASFPSSHAVVAFALAFAVSSVWPRTIFLMCCYALAIAVTRVVLLAHHPSDVVAGALTGVVGAMAVRYWFAARHMVFTIESGGSVRALAGPSWERLKGVAREAVAP